MVFTAVRTEQLQFSSSRAAGLSTQTAMAKVVVLTERALGLCAAVVENCRSERVLHHQSMA